MVWTGFPKIFWSLSMVISQCSNQYLFRSLEHLNSSIKRIMSLGSTTFFLIQPDSTVWFDTDWPFLQSHLAYYEDMMVWCQYIHVFASWRKNPDTLLLTKWRWRKEMKTLSFIVLACYLPSLLEHFSVSIFENTKERMPLNNVKFGSVATFLT